MFRAISFVEPEKLIEVGLSANNNVLDGEDRSVERCGESGCRPEKSAKIGRVYEG
jgi:hypothetical protein